MKYIKYKLALRRLRRATKAESDVKKLCEWAGIEFDDLNLRNIQKAKDRIKSKWLRRNLID